MLGPSTAPRMEMKWAARGGNLAHSGDGFPLSPSLLCHTPGGWLATYLFILQVCNFCGIICKTGSNTLPTFQTVDILILTRLAIFQKVEKVLELFLRKSAKIYTTDMACHASAFPWTFKWFLPRHCFQLPNPGYVQEISDVWQPY